MKEFKTKCSNIWGLKRIEDLYTLHIYDVNKTVVGIKILDVPTEEFNRLTLQKVELYLLGRGGRVELYIEQDKVQELVEYLMSLPTYSCFNTNTHINMELIHFEQTFYNGTFLMYAGGQYGIEVC